jgi:hypothetical protein
MTNGERRKHSCEMYEVIHRIEDKVDAIAERQVVYMEMLYEWWELSKELEERLYEQRH